MTLAARLVLAAFAAPRRAVHIVPALVGALVLGALLASLIVRQALWDEMDDGLGVIGLWYAAILAGLVIAGLWFLEAGSRRYLGALIAPVILIGGYGELHSAMALSIPDSFQLLGMMLALILSLQSARALIVDAAMLRTS